jgi:hypothetical protein
MWLAKETPLRPPVFISKRSFDIPFFVDPTTREQTREVILYVSKDHGRTVEIADRQLPTAKCFHYRAPGDGMYWFVVRTENMDYRPRSVDTPIDQPSQRICVDTVRPEARLQLIRRQDDMISVRWDVDDENLDKQSIQLGYQRIDGKTWTKLPIEPATEGRYVWNVLDNIEVLVRLRVRDKAGNESIAALSIPPEERP